MYATDTTLLEPPVIVEPIALDDEPSMPASRVVMLTLAMLALFALAV